MPPDRTLFHHLRPEFREVIDTLVARNLRRETILDYARQSARHFAVSPEIAAETIAGIEAYLDSLQPRTEEPRTK